MKKRSGCGTRTLVDTSLNAKARRTTHCAFQPQPDEYNHKQNTIYTEIGKKNKIRLDCGAIYSLLYLQAS
jgi:hypothetical protein